MSGSQALTTYAQRVCDDFFGFWRHFEYDFEGDGRVRVFPTLQSYINICFGDGKGVDLIAARYANFLLAEIVIIDAYTRDPSRLDYEDATGVLVKRRPANLLDLSGAR